MTQIYVYAHGALRASVGGLNEETDSTITPQ